MAPPTLGFGDWSPGDATPAAVAAAQGGSPTQAPPPASSGPATPERRSAQALLADTGPLFAHKGQDLHGSHASRRAWAILSQAYGHKDFSVRGRGSLDR